MSHPTIEAELEQAVAERDEAQREVDRLRQVLWSVATTLPIGALNKGEEWVPTEKDIADGIDLVVRPWKESAEEERRAKRHFADHLADVVLLGRALTAYQPAARASTQVEADLWAKFYAALNDAPVSGK